VLRELNRGKWQVLIDHIREKFDVSCGVVLNPLNKTSISRRQEELSQVVHLDGNGVLLPIDHLLQLSHVLQVSVDWVQLLLGYGGVGEGRDEVGASFDLLVVIWYVDVSVDL